MLRKVAFSVISLYSSSALSAGITIDVDLDLTIDAIKYVDVDSQNADLTNSKLVSFNPQIMSSGLDYVTLFFENDDLSLDALYRDGNILKRTRLTNEGQKLHYAYPEVSYQFEKAFAVNGIPYVIDRDNDTILQWDAEQSAWKDLSLAVTLPTGEYDAEAFVYSDSLYFSEASTGMWRLGLAPLNVSENRIKESRLVGTIHGLAELKLESGVPTVNWISESYPDLNLSVVSNQGSVTAFDADSDSSGTVYQFQLEGEGLLLLWDGLNDAEDGVVKIEQNHDKFKGCFWSTQTLLCSFLDVGESLYFYELVDGKLRLDTKISQLELINPLATIVTVLTSGTSRFIVSKLGDLYQLHEVNESGYLLLEQASFKPTEGFAALMFSKSRSQFYWIESGESKSVVYKGVLKGSLEHVALIESSEDSASVSEANKTLPDANDTLENVEKAQDEMLDAQDNTRKEVLEDQEQDGGKESDMEGVGSLATFYLGLVWLIGMGRRKPD